LELQTLRLPYHGACNWAAALAFLTRRAIDGVEQVESGTYRRTISCDGASGTIAVAHDEDGSALLVTVRAPSALGSLVAGRVRRMFDLDTDVAAVAAHLEDDPAMAPLVRLRSALRVYRGWEGFEVAARSIIGQQVTVDRARRLNGTLVDRCGGDLPGSVDDRLRRVFPTPQQVLDGDLSRMGMPGARVATLEAVAHAAIEDPRLFHRGRSLDETIARLRSIRGIGDWTAHYIAMRACGEPDAFPASDIGLLRGAADPSGRRPTPAQLLVRAERWRPWRAYAAHYLWAQDQANADATQGRRAVRGATPAPLP
jgi:AraC family transcriptional regulator of adaptative response / DNA-3-methyladenine glycosylase II